MIDRDLVVPTGLAGRTTPVLCSQAPQDTRDECDRRHAFWLSARTRDDTSERLLKQVLSRHLSRQATGIYAGDSLETQ